MKKRRTIERCVRLGVAIACVSAATVLRAGDRAEVSVAGSERADTASFRDIYPDTWVATDAVGRTMPTEEEVGLPKNDQRRVVGIFYITWHTQGLHNLKSPYTADVTKILEQDPSARLDAHHPLWKEGSYHWGEPEMGYFLSQDEWVIRKDVSMLADAGVDVMIMDVTNAVRYWDEWDVIFRTMQRMKAEGNKVPKFCFWAFNGPVITVVQDLYDRIYKPGLYSDLWFEWDGKPLLLYNSRPGIDAAESSNPNTNPHYDPDAVTNPANPHYGDPDYTEKVYKDYTSEVKDFFTLRTMWWGYYEWGGERFVGTEDNWSFGYNMADPKVAALKPEELLSTHNGRREQAAVTPAQHPMTMAGPIRSASGNRGRAHRASRSSTSTTCPFRPMCPGSARRSSIPSITAFTFRNAGTRPSRAIPSSSISTTGTSGRPANTSPAAKARRCPGSADRVLFILSISTTPSSTAAFILSRAAIPITITCRWPRI